MSTLESRAADEADRASRAGIIVGELSSLRDLYARHGVRTYSLALHLTEDAPIAESVVEAVFLAVWRNAASPRFGGTDVGAWLAALVEYRAPASTRGRAGGATPNCHIRLRPRLSGLELHLGDEPRRRRSGPDELPRLRRQLEVLHRGRRGDVRVAR